MIERVRRLFVRRSFSGGLCLWMTALLLLAGCQKHEADQPVVLGITPFSGYAYFYLADAKGFLKQHGANVELTDFSSLADVRRAYERGQIDVMPGTLVELLGVLSMSDHAAQAFLVIDYSKGADALLADSKIKTIAELKGKKIAFEAGTVDMVMLHHALQSAGMTLADIKPVPMPQAEMPAAFASGKIDAAEVYPPVSLEILASGKAHKLFDSSQVPLTVADVLIAEKDYIQKKSGELAALVKAYYEAKDFAQAHPEEARRIICQRIGIREEDYDSAFQGVEFFGVEEQAGLLQSKGSIENVLIKTHEVLKQYGFFKDIDFTVKKVNDSIVKKVRPS